MFVQSHNNQLRSPRWARHPPLPQGALCGVHPASPGWSRRDADFGESSAVEDQLGLLYVVLLRDGGAKTLSLFDLQWELEILLQ